MRKEDLTRRGRLIMFLIVENELQKEIKKKKKTTSECICNSVHSVVNPSHG